MFFQSKLTYRKDFIYMQKSMILGVVDLVCYVIVQYEGATNEGGRGASIWESFTQRYPGNTSLFLCRDMCIIVI